MAQVFKLYQLQQLDSQMDQIKQRIAENQRKLKDETALNKINYEIDQTNQTLHKHQIEDKRLEDQIHTLRVKLEQNQSTLYGGKVSNPKELQDLQNEAAAINRQLEVLEDQLLEKMIETEDVQSYADELQRKFQEASVNLEFQKQKLGAEIKALEQELDQIVARRTPIAQSAPDDELQIYESIRSKRGGIGVAIVVDQACSACGSAINSVLLQHAKSPSHIAYCDTCGRILYAG